MNGMVRSWLVTGVLMAWGISPVLAHKGSDAYLDVQQPGRAASAVDAGSAPTREIRFALAVAIKDLDQILPLDANADGKVTWGEIRAATPLVQALLNEAASIEHTPATQPPVASPGAALCHLAWQADGVEQRGDGAYMRMAAQARCPVTQALAFRYTLFKDQDATHRLLVAGRVDGKDLLTTTSPQHTVPLLLSTGTGTGTGTTPQASRWSALRDYFLLGMHHLLEGYDHLAFLLALVLPLRLSLLRVPTSLVAVPGVSTSGNVWLALLRTVTAFTIGHSITLMLATLGWTQASPAWVEPVIAASIAVTALLNLRPVAWVRTDLLALVFGLVHGFGFAGLLQEAAAPNGLLPWALAGFNIGVEAGQLFAVTVWVLLSQLFVARPWYGSVVVRGGSIALSVLAAWWFWERVR